MAINKTGQPQFVQDLTDWGIKPSFGYNGAFS